MSLTRRRLAVCQALALTTLAALALTALIPAAVQAQTVTFTLSNVVFDDGGTATGSFAYDFSSSAPGLFDDAYVSYNITTTAGTSPVGGRTNPPPGTHYMSTVANTGGYRNGDIFYINSNAAPYDTLFLTIPDAPVSPNTYALQPGDFNFPDSIYGSGEGVNGNSDFNNGQRYITSGFLVANEPVPPLGSPVPEASTTVSCGLLLTLGAGGLIILARKKKAAAV